jgi:hypothetical protein
MLDYSNNVEHSLFGFKHCFDLTIRGCLVDSGQSKKFVWAVESLWGSSYISLVISSWREVPGPVWIFIVCIGEHVIILCGPINILCCNWININRWCWVDKLNVVLNSVVLIVVLDKSIGRSKVLYCILEVKVRTHHYYDVVSAVMSGLVQNYIVKLSS